MDHDHLDKDNSPGSDTPQTFGGPSLFTDKQGQPAEIQQAEVDTLTAPSRDDQTQQSGEAQSSSGDELIEILSGVEKQIERLRGLHLTHEKKLNSIAQRSRALEEAEISFDSDNSSLRQREQQLEDKANELDEQQQQLADQQAQHEQERQSLEQEQAVLRELQEAAQSELQAQQQQLADQQAELEQEQESHKQERAEFAKQQKDSQIELESFKEQHEQALADEEQQLHEEQEQQVASLAEIEQAQLEIEKQREEFNNEREALQALRLENVDQSASFEEREVEFQLKQIELDQKQQRYITQQREIEKEREYLLNQKESFELKKAELDKKRRDFELQQSHLQQQVNIVTEKGSELEEQNRLLKDELAQRDRALDEITSKVQHQDTKLQERFCTLKEESKLLEKKLKEQELQILQDEQAASTVKQQEEQLEQLQSQLASIKIKADPNLMQRKDERIEELVEALHQARGQIGGEQSIDESEARVQQLLSENEQLRIQLERSSIEADNKKQTWEALTEAISTSAPADESKAVEEEIQALQTQVHVLHQEADEQDSQTENDELEIISRVQQSIESDEVENVVVDESSTYRGANPLEHPNVQAPLENQVIVPPQDFLKRKAGPIKIITTLGWLTVASVIIAGASWLAANHYFPATVSASVVFKAGSQSNAALTSEQKQIWQAWHTNLLTDADFTTRLSKRLAARRLDKYADVNTLRVYLAEHLEADLAQPDAITLKIDGTNKNELAALLDTLATTFINESNEYLKDNGNGLKTLAVGTKKQGNQVLYASLNPTPILDERLKYASYMFAVGFGGAVVMVTIISRRPVKPTDIFTDNDPVFVTLQR